jgi:hypothetical protein
MGRSFFCLPLVFGESDPGLLTRSSGGGGGGGCDSVRGRLAGRG